MGLASATMSGVPVAALFAQQERSAAPHRLGVSLLATRAKLRQIENAAVPRPRLKFGLWLSLVERSPRVRKVAGSNPVSPINPRHPAPGLSAFTRQPLILHRIHEPNRPYHFGAHRFWSGFFPRRHSDALVAVRLDGEGAEMERIQNDCGHGAGRHRSCSRHCGAGFGDYAIWRGS
jgi:hypothetical protein